MTSLPATTPGVADAALSLSKVLDVASAFERSGRQLRLRALQLGLRFGLLSAKLRCVEDRDQFASLDRRPRSTRIVFTKPFTRE